MNGSLSLVLLILAGCIAAFILNKPRMDVVALLAIVLLTVCGVLDVSEALSGFSDPNVVLIAALFAIGEGLVRTGVAHRLGTWLIEKAGSSETRLLILLMLAVAGLGSFMSSTGVVAIFIPVAIGITLRLGVPAGRLMMPLSFAGLMSGMMTLVATPPNMVVDSALKHAGLRGFDFFAFTPIGAVILLAGVAYMLIARRWLTIQKSSAPELQQPRSLNDFIDEYGLAAHEMRLRIRPDSPLVGQTLEQLQTRRRYGANVIAIERPGLLQSTIIHPRNNTQLRPGDVLLVDAIDRSDARTAWPSELGAEPLPLSGKYFLDQSSDIGLAEIIVTPESHFLGKSIRDRRFRSTYGLTVIGLRRGNVALPTPVADEKLKMGDTLLVIGPWKAIRQSQVRNRDFILLSLPAEIDQAIPARARAPYALLSLVVMVVLMVTGVVPNVIAGLIACLLMGLFRCIDMDGAYRSIHWKSIVLIVGMIPFSVALGKTGGVELAAEALLRLVGDASPHLILASLFMFTAVIGLFISNTATAVLMAPIALSVANHLGSSPYPFAMTVALAASAAFMTPVSSPVNTLVMGPGQYRFVDFVKVGVPFTTLVMIITIVMVPWLFPLDAK